MEINKIEDIKSEIEENINPLEKKPALKALLSWALKTKLPREQITAVLGVDKSTVCRQMKKLNWRCNLQHAIWPKKPFN